MYLQFLSTRNPPVSYSQSETWDIFAASPAPERLRPGSVELVRKVLTGANGIERRHFALHDFERLLNSDGEQLNREFEREAPALGGAVLEDALDGAGWKAGELDALIVCSCTGYLCPGLTSFIAEQKGLRPDAFLVDLVGHGCGAAIPAMRTASNFITAHPEARVAVVAVEICTAAFYIDDEAGVLVSFCLFGDGAAATLWTGKRGKGPGYCSENFTTIHEPHNRELLRFENSMGMLRNKLHPRLPEESSRAVCELYRRNFADAAPPGAVISHGGGRKVLDGLEAGLPGLVLDESRQVLRNYGNMSSPSVLFALKEHLEGGSSADHLWLTSFGAGFTVHGMQLRR